MNELALVASVLIAIFGSIGGFAALMKVNADNSQTIADGASTVVEMVLKRLDDTEKRLGALEAYSLRFDDWGDQLTNLVNRAISAMEEPPRESFRVEAAKVAAARPRRRGTDTHGILREETTA
jgi:hypothetical protein